MTYRDIKLEYITRNELNNIIDYINNRKNKMEKFNFSRPFHPIRAYEKYQIKTKKESTEIIYFFKGKLRRVLWSLNTSHPEQVNNDGLSGQDAYVWINNEYKKRKNKYKSVSLFSDISGEKYKAEYEAIKKCVPAAINYCAKGCINKIIEKVYKADVSSAYPSACCGTIPTLHGCQRVKGRVEPTEEYPFAFYIKSHHLAIYKELNTKTFKKSFYYHDQYNNPHDKSSWTPNDKIKAEDDETILCKDSGISLKPIFEELYAGRNNNAEFKFIMNAFIGRCQLNSNPVMSHLSAVVLARTVNNMIERCKTLEKEKSIPIFISTDSIAWFGNPSTCATYEKYLGSFTYEAYDSKFFLRGLKAYQYIDLNGKVKGVCGHIKKDDPRRQQFGAIPPVSAHANTKIIYRGSDGKINVLF